MSTSTIEYHQQSAVRGIASLVEIAQKLQAENDALKAPWGKFEPYEAIKTPSKFWDVTKPGVWEEYCRVHAEDMETAGRNAQVVQRNNALLERLVSTITATGVAATRREQKRRKTEEITNDWLVALRASRPALQWSTSQLQGHFADHKRKYEEHCRKAEEARRMSERQSQMAERDRRVMVVTVDVAKELGLDPLTASTLDVHSELRKRDRYLDLAVAGMNVRGDWSDGPWEVEDALRRFTPQTTDDKTIAEDWQAMCDDFEDGRCFRDCKWNYSVLMGMVDPQVAAMYSRLVNAEEGTPCPT